MAHESTSDACSCPGYVRAGIARSKAGHEHWHGRPSNKQITVRNAEGEKVAIVPVKAASVGIQDRQNGYSHTQEDADRAIRLMNLIISAPDMERLLWMALKGDEDWRPVAAAVLRFTGFLPPLVAPDR